MAESLQAERTSGADAVSEARWYALYTRSRHEKQVHRLLGERGIETFLPLVPRIMQWKDRKQRVEWPLFPSYVFGRFGLEEAHRVLATPGVATVVRIDGRPAAIADDEIENVRRLADALRNGGVKAEPRPFLTQGQWVEITRGPLAGVRGVVEQHRNRKRVLIGLQTIGQGMAVDIDVASLLPVPGPG